jgi:UDP-N-acetylglucosamine:LPS N-acetylglucosamine transferase
MGAVSTGNRFDQLGGATTVAGSQPAGSLRSWSCSASAGGHQELNARALETAEAALVVLQEKLSGPLLARLIIELMRDTARLDRMSEASRRLGRPDAAEKIVEACLELVGSH